MKEADDKKLKKIMASLLISLSLIAVFPRSNALAADNGEVSIN